MRKKPKTDKNESEEPIKISRDQKREDRAKAHAGNMKGKEPEAPASDYSHQNTRGLYNDELLPKVEELASKGLTNAQIARALCIGNRTFYDWMDRYPQFSHSIKKYRGVADIMVENALFKSACGGEFTEVKTERRWNKDRKEYELVVTEMLTKHVPGSATAQIFYLKNRMPHRYKDKVETEISLGQNVSAMGIVIRRRED